MKGLQWHPSEIADNKTSSLESDGIIGSETRGSRLERFDSGAWSTDTPSKRKVTCPPCRPTMTTQWPVILGEKVSHKEFMFLGMKLQQRGEDSTRQRAKTEGKRLRTTGQWMPEDGIGDGPKWFNRELRRCVNSFCFFLLSLFLSFLFLFVEACAYLPHAPSFYCVCLTDT